MEVLRVRKDTGRAVSVKKPKCADCGAQTYAVVKTASGALVYLCGSCEYRREHPDALRPIKLPRERTKRLQKEQLFQVDGE